MAKSEKIIQPINASMDDIAKAVVKPKQELNNDCEKNKEPNKYQKKDNLSKKIIK